MPAPPFGTDFPFDGQAATDFIRRHPEASPLVTGDGVRKKMLAGYPYALFYAQEEDGRCWIYAVAHEKRRPGYWLDRIKP